MTPSRFVHVDDLFGVPPQVVEGFGERSPGIHAFPFFPFNAVNSPVFLGQS